MKMSFPVVGGRALHVCLLLLLSFSCAQRKDDPFAHLTRSSNDLHFDKLSDTWDEAIPLGNGMVGALIWKKDGKLRFSLDRADLWDLRPAENLSKDEYSFNWVCEQWKNDNYAAVQELFDKPYDKSPAPSKIPGAALEFDISNLGEIASVHLYIEEAVCEVKWKNGARLLTFVHATEPVGYYRFEGVESTVAIELVAPAYQLSEGNEQSNPVDGQDLRKLEYSKGSISKEENAITYNQAGWGGFKYQVNVRSETQKGFNEGVWSISAEHPDWEKTPIAKDLNKMNQKTGLENIFKTHKNWWSNYWSKSSIDIPDTLLKKQWYLEQYKFGAAARSGAPPISLQAVWTADNGKLPPWKGDYHHDLNTQLSYWPAYSGNHLDEEIGFLEWLWKNRPAFKTYTKTYFKADGINVPGVTTLTGEPMGGWIQYSFGPTVSAWLGHHFYLHWRYSMDREFLKERAYPWIKDVAVFIDEIAETNEEGYKKLPISSSPEIFGNSRKAWFEETTNYDLALIRWIYEKANELALELGETEEAEKWKKILDQWPNLLVDNVSGLMFGKDVPYKESHRHFSHLMGFHPLAIIDFSNGESDQKIIKNTLKTLTDVGPDYWTGYSYSWLGNLKARAFDGDGAAEALRIFATSFCLPSSFHVNGDQSGKGYSTFTYRPFTLEGNFAFAAGIQEMLLQSHTGIVHVFPAVPKEWKDASFDKLRTEGAFLVSAKMENGSLREIKVKSEMGGTIALYNSFGNGGFKCSKSYTVNENGKIIINTEIGDSVILESVQ